MGIQLDSLEMVGDVENRFDAREVEAYGPLLVDAMRGDQTLFKHRIEVESAWDAVMPFIGPGSAAARKGIHDNYAPGSWGPSSADELLARTGRAWKND
jgi:glucose-6-phosphate 1-dehydrogenase